MPIENDLTVAPDNFLFDKNPSRRINFSQQSENKN